MKKPSFHTFLFGSALALTLTAFTTPGHAAAWNYKSESTTPQKLGEVVTQSAQKGWQFVSMAAATEGTAKSPTVIVLFRKGGKPPPAEDPNPGTGGLLEGAVAHWAFEDNGQDSIGDHLLTIGGAGYGPRTLTYAEGKIGKAMSQYGNTPSFVTPKIAEIDYNHDFTLSVWLYREASIYDNDAVFDSGSFYLAKRDAAPWNSRMGVFIDLGSPGQVINLVDNSPMGQPPLRTWYHVIVFRKGGQLGIKVNNEGTATVDVSGIDLSGGPTVYVGHQQFGYAWQGRIDDVWLWNRALTASEMTMVYGSGTGVYAQKPVAPRQNTPAMLAAR
jgi:hypothetical protein